MIIESLPLILASISAIGTLSIGIFLFKFWRGLNPTIKKAFSQLSAKGVDARDVKRLEGLVVTDMKNMAQEQYPELEVFLAALSGETQQLMEEKPYLIPVLLTRWAPYLKAFRDMALGQLTNQSGKKFNIE